jgi:hypothetical protein
MKVGLSENLLCLFCVFANFWFIHNRITVCSSLNKKCDPALYILVIAWFFCPNSPQRLGALQRIYLTPGPHPRPIFIRRRRPQRFVIATHFRAS